MESEPIITPLIAIVGVTASGKSKLAMQLAERFDGEIICADSRTVYKGMDIGTAKPSKKDQKAITHHLLDIINPDETFNVREFKQLALDAIHSVAAQDKLPILVGGTGLYIDAILFDYQFSPAGARRSLHNPRHLKYQELTAYQRPLRTNSLVIGLSQSKDQLQVRVKERVEAMFHKGLINETKTLVQKYGWEAPGLNTIGYREWQEYFAGRQTLEQTQDLITLRSLQYAKRQRTWFKRNNSIHWVDDPMKVVDLVTTFLNKKQ
ncbi:MAG TPA: tRNA (adenosine(37)-N6)-dimethylallyltransferase MiaA [Candidatus Saccharimonadales bacterium]|nr:tRNA (adenosine(37)-N6)-dimethylallyltransferase MiaA [Candidatus Saccharimonadales bacterium]